MDVGVLISGLFGVVGSGSALLTFFYFRKQQKRLKNAEAVEMEVETLRKTVETLQKNQEFYENRLAALQSLVIEKESYVQSLTTDKHTLEVKHSRNKSAINEAYSCLFCTDKAKCPVLVRRARNDDDYLKRIEQKNNVDSNRTEDRS